MLCPYWIKKEYLLDIIHISNPKLQVISLHQGFLGVASNKATIHSLYCELGKRACDGLKTWNMEQTTT